MNDREVEEKLDELETDTIPKKSISRKCATCSSTDHVKSVLVVLRRKKGGKCIKKMFLCAKCRKNLAERNEK